MGLHAGIDVGSLTCKAVVTDDTGAVLGNSIVATGARSRISAEAALTAALEKARVARADLNSLVTTGYGRENVEGRDRSVTEITCHAAGAIRLFPKTRLIIDVGGQDSKAIRVGANGRVTDFAMNDKCAAGTGRFFEVMARALEIDLADLGPRALLGSKPLTLSTTCTVFAESEVVGLIARGETVENIASALCRAASERVMNLVNRVGVADEVTVTGGVAKNQGFVAAIEKLLGKTANVPDEPQIVGAYGAALIAWQYACGERATPAAASGG